MKYSVWYWLFIMFLAACGSKVETTEPPASTELGVKSPAERKASNFAVIADAKKLIQDGDLILRAGIDFSSNHIREMSLQEKVYSHGGIAFHDSTGELYICHIVTEFYHVRDKVRWELLDSFTNPAENSGFAIARYKIDPAELKKFKSYLDKQYEKRIPFDMRFDLATNDSMYCAEMIKKGLSKATKGRIEIETAPFFERSKYKVIKQYLKIPEKDFVGRLYVPVDRLYLRPDCQVIKRFVFE